ncbi:MAG: hypothetical protein FWE04_01695 [Oscillospiraceae bacterium]|nr:hypothetical protein [Oscillospiraceae bacterium]
MTNNQNYTTGNQHLAKFLVALDYVAEIHENDDKRVVYSFHDSDVLQRDIGAYKNAVKKVDKMFRELRPKKNDEVWQSCPPNTNDDSE